MEDVCTNGQVITGEILEPQISALAQSEGIAARAAGLGDPAPKAKKPRKSRTASKFVVIPAEMLKLDEALPNLVAARKRAESLGMNGTFYIACLREEVAIETITPKPVTKVAVKRVTR